MNTTKYVRSPKNKKSPYTKISNSIAQLPAVEAGIMLQILSNSDDWVINKDVVKKRSGLGKVSFEKHWKHLQQLGHIITKKLKDKNGVIYYEHTIYENPEAQNSTQEIDNPYTDFRTTETHTTDNRITVTGGTNNYQVINEDQETICSSGSDGLSTEVEVRPGNNNTRTNILGKEENVDDNLQIVPHPSLRDGEVRDDKSSGEEDQKVTLPTKTKRQEPFSWEYYNPNGDEISDEDIKLIEDLPNALDSELKEVIDHFFLEKVPDWESRLFKHQFIRPFFAQTEKLVETDYFLGEVINEYFKRIKKGNY